ncbi:MAG: hypothetical protein PHE84_07760 [bacterium]|nr:hypothetical protein [bacterium]
MKNIWIKTLFGIWITFLGMNLFGCGKNDPIQNSINKVLSATTPAKKQSAYQELIAKYKPEDLNSQRLNMVGKIGISLNDPSNAKAYFSAIQSIDPEYGEAQYGIMLTDIQYLISSYSSALLCPVVFVSTANYESQTIIDGPTPDEILELESLKHSLDTISMKADEIIANRYSFSTDDGSIVDIPIVAGCAGGSYYQKISLKGRAGTLEARLIKIMSNLGIAMIETANAHDLTADYGKLFQIISCSPVVFVPEETLGNLRRIGRIFADNPKFLAKNITRWDSNMTDVPARYIAAIDAFRELDTDLINTAKSTAAECDDVICLISSDAAINAGDQLRINGTIHIEAKMTISQDYVDKLSPDGEIQIDILPPGVVTGEITTSGIILDIDLANENLIELSQVFLEPIGRIIPSLDTFMSQIESSINNGTALGTVDINPVITALDPTLPVFPNGLFTLAIKPLFDMPFRDLVGYFECGNDTLPGKGNYCFAIETEQVNLANQCGTDYWCGKSYYAQGDNGHFNGVKLISTKYPDGISINISPDGIAPKARVLQSGSTTKYHLISPDTLFYFGFGDATFNGALKLNLSKLPAPFNANEPPGLAGPGNYEMNKLINWMIVDYAQRVEDAGISKACRSCLDLLPLDIISPFLTCSYIE